MSKIKVLKEMVEELARVKKRNRDRVREIKRKVAKKYGADLPSNAEVLKTYRTMVEQGRVDRSDLVEWLLVTRPVRSLSGIVNVTVLTEPHPCPGTCIYCPSEKGFPKSYLSGEPAADRAKGVEFDPFLQVTRRLEGLKAQGHPTDKIELRIVGGSWSSYPADYRRLFVKQCFSAANNFSEEEKTEYPALEKAQKANEGAENRIVGLSVETRPDLITKKEVGSMRRLGVTFVEMGVQTLDDQIHERCGTNLSVQKIARATRLLKDSGFKILYQMMPGLPGSTVEKDIETFETLFHDQRFKPDWLKIYPCLVCENSPLYRTWKEGRYDPLEKEELIRVLSEIKKSLPYWVRVARIFRDIPAEKIMAGCRSGNIREVVKKRMKKKGMICSCIRCREVRERYDPGEKVILFKEDYRASEGKEVFFSFENEDRTKLYSLLRLRIPSRPFVKPLKGAGIIREVQTFGPQIPISKQKKGAQHKGLGARLIKQAEKAAAQEFGLKKMAVISGIGVRQYYREKHGYRKEETYMTKEL